MQSEFDKGIDVKVIRATSLGMCFGVKDALVTAREAPNPEETTIYGQLVHNPQVLVELDELGYQQTREKDRPVPQTDRVLITAHGLSRRRKRQLTALGKQLIDTTCPLVSRVHAAADELVQAGYLVVLIGKAGHVEVEGVVEDYADIVVVSSERDVQQWDRELIGVLCQTTTPPRIASEILETIECRNPNSRVRFFNTICQPTMDRQYAVEQLCLRVGLVVVVGGPNSNNTRQLVELAEHCGAAAYQVESARDLREEWFDGLTEVGLTAGTSTLDECVDEVERALQAIRVPEVSQ